MAPTLMIYTKPSAMTGQVPSRLDSSPLSAQVLGSHPQQLANIKPPPLLSPITHLYLGTRSIHPRLNWTQSSSRSFRGWMISWKTNNQPKPLQIHQEDLSTSIPCPNQKTLSPLSAQAPYLACWSEILEPQSDTHANFAICEDMDDETVSSKLLTNSTLAWILKELLTNSLHAPQQSFSEVTPGLNLVGSRPQGNRAYITTPGKIREATKQARCTTAFKEILQKTTRHQRFYDSSIPHSRAYLQNHC
ncbi:hypothetical protein VP01_1323g1 [Puccinia sorghi]|uniref:Uncharacterized protein n=1 Tax=Puccinia sorghi TaxID=27349 RepID=A0A0L6VMK6_9BASI|nr:hypothetical protein VP01_1323g1 [Puccinia sorghi]